MRRRETGWRREAARAQEKWANRQPKWPPVSVLQVSC